MVHFVREEIFEIPLEMLGFYGESEDGRASVGLIFFRIINCIVILPILMYMILDFFQVEPPVFSDILLGIAAVSHGCLKYLLVIYVKHDTGKLTSFVVNKLNQFKQEINETIFKYLRNIVYIQKCLVVLGGLTLFMLYFRAALNSDYFFLFESALSNSLAIDAIILLCQYYYFLFGFVIVFGYDIMYFVLCVLTALLLRLLKQQLRRIINSKDARMKDEFEQCIRHYKDFLLIFSQMNRINSAILLFEYIVIMVSLCSQLFMFVMYTSVTSKFIFMLGLLTLFAEFGCYAFPGEYVASEFADLCVSLYATKWYINSVKFQKLILFMMMKSQRIQYFSGGGFVDINIDTYGTVIKKAFSFYAVMRNLLRK